MTDFEDRLEHELIAAAARLAPPARSSRRRPRPLPVAAVALAAIVALTVAALTLPSGHAPQPAAPPQTGGTLPPTTGPLPRQCDPDRRRGSMPLRITRRGIDRRLYDTYAVLRRPQTATDRSVCPAWSFGGLLNPSAVRFVGTDGDGHRVFLVPMAGLPDRGPSAARGEFLAPWEVRALTGPQLCTTIVYPNSSAGGPCHKPSWYGRGRFNTLGVRPGGANVLVGVFSDGVESVRLAHESGRTTLVPVRDNVAIVLWRGAARDDGVLSYTLLNRSGESIVTRRDSALRQRDDGTVELNVDEHETAPWP